MRACVCVCVCVCVCFACVYMTFKPGFLVRHSGTQLLHRRHDTSTPTPTSKHQYSRVILESRGYAGTNTHRQIHTHIRTHAHTHTHTHTHEHTHTHTNCSTHTHLVVDPVRVSPEEVLLFSVPVWSTA